jgi:hypothetical protein
VLDDEIKKNLEKEITEQKEDAKRVRERDCNYGNFLYNAPFVYFQEVSNVGKHSRHSHLLFHVIPLHHVLLLFAVRKP